VPNHYWIVNDRDRQERCLTEMSYDDNSALVGDVSREALSSLDSWKIRMNPKGYGLAYRVGRKRAFIDSEGRPAELFIYFSKPIAEKNRPLRVAEVRRVEEALHTAVCMAANGLAQHYQRVIVATAFPPEYMLRELDETLGKTE